MTHRERCQAECTRDVIFLFQVRMHMVVKEPPGYAHDGEGWRPLLDEDDCESYDPDAEYATMDELRKLNENTDPFIFDWWETKCVFLDRQEAREWRDRQHYNYPGIEGEKWRVYGVPAEGELARMLSCKVPDITDDLYQCPRCKRKLLGYTEPPTGCGCGWTGESQRLVA